jgi:hypothetical protein
MRAPVWLVVSVGERVMDRLVLQVEGARPLRRGKTVVASGTVVAWLVGNVMLTAFVIALGWSLATGHISSLHI